MGRRIGRGFPARPVKPFRPRGTTGDTTPPAAPTGLVATAISAFQIDLDWADNGEGDLASYRVHRSTTSGFTASAANRIAEGLSASLYQDTTASPSTTYYYKVTAVDTSGNESSASAQASATTSAAAAAAPLQRHPWLRPIHETVHWTIDDISVPVDKWAPSVVAHGGFDQLSGAEIPAGSAEDVGQGSVIKAYRSTGGVLWEGKIVAPPRVRRGVAQIRAVGWKSLLEKAGGRLTYQSRKYDLWAPSDAEPHGYGQSGLIKVDNDGALHFSAQEISVAGSSGMLLWIQGQPLTRITFHRSWTTGTTTEFELRLYTATGPDGPRTLRTTWSLDGIALGSPLDSNANYNDDIDYFIPADVDLVELRLQYTASPSPATSLYLTITDLLVNGLAVGDTMTSSAVVADVFARAGIGIDAVSSAATNVLPLDWQGSRTDLLTFLGDLEGWRWLVLGGREGGFGPWGGFSGERTWELAQELDADPDLEDMEVYSRGIISWRDTAGTTRETVVRADPNPLEGKDDNDWPETLPGEWPDDALPLRYAEARMDEKSRRRVRGKILVAQAFGPDGQVHPYEVLAGDLADVTSYGAELPPQRIVSSIPRPDGLNEVTIEQEVSQDVLLARLAAEFGLT